MNKNILDKIEGLKYSVSDEYNEITSNVNSLTTDTYNTISKSLNDVTNIKNKISVISDMFTDLRVLNGTAKNMIYLSTLPVVENSGIKVKDDKFILDTLIKKNKEIYVKESSLSSVDNYKLYTLDGKGTTLDTFLKSGIETLVQFDNTRYTFTLNLRYSTVEQINSIDLQLGLLTESYPIINSIKYIDKDNIERTAVILNNTSTSYDLDYNREVDNKYTLDISPILTNQINIELTSKTNSNIILKNIKTYFKKEIESANIIVGPIHTEKPLLKVALDCEELSKGCSFELSTDLEYWLKLDSSSIITDELNTKILSFNTINEKSIKTTEDIYTFYIKISIESSLLTNDDVDVNLYNTLREDHSINNDTLELVDDNLFSTYKVKSSDFIHGQYQYIENLNTKDLSLESIEYLEVNGNSKVLGLVDTPYSLTDKTENTSGGIGGELKLKRLPSNFIIDSTKYDLANSKVYDIFLRDIEDTINTREKDNLCLTLKRRKALVVEDDFSAPYDINGIVEDIVWTVNPEYNRVGSSVEYTGTLNTSIGVYDSYANLDLTEAIVRSLHDIDIQQEQSVKDAIFQLTTLTSDYTFDSVNKRIFYTDTTKVYKDNKYLFLSDTQSDLPQNWVHNPMKAVETACAHFATVQPAGVYTFEEWQVSPDQWVADKTKTILWTVRNTYPEYSYTDTSPNQQISAKIDPNYSPDNPLAKAYTDFIQIVDKIISNSLGGNLIAKNFIESIANSIFDPNESKQFVKLSDLIDQFEENKVKE